MALYRERRIKGWSALVTGDFFGKTENLELVREAGCKALFSGIESFDSKTLLSYNKRQDTSPDCVSFRRFTSIALTLPTASFMT